MKAFSLPAITIFPNHLDFGEVALDSSRTLYFDITNVLPFDCPCVTVDLPSEFISFFEISNVNFILQMGETKSVGITFTPRANVHKIKAEFLILAAGIQVERIKMTASSEPFLQSFDSDLYLGECDIYAGFTVKKRIMLKNKSALTRPFYIESSTGEILNRDKLSILPGDSRFKYELEFDPCIRGKRKEKVTLYFPQKAVTYDLNLFCGKYIHIPLFEEVVFSPTVAEQDVRLSLPIVNLCGELLDLIFILPANCPFSLRISETNITEHADKKEYRVILKNSISVSVDIVLLSETAGLYRVPMDVVVKSHRTFERKRFYLTGVVYDTSIFSLQGYNVINTFYNFYQAPDGFALTGQRPPLSSSQVFEMDPPMLTISANLHDEDVYQFLTITNMASKEQKYRIFVSYPFITNIPLEGTIAPISAIEIPVFIDLNWIERNYVDEIALYGTICIMDDSDETALCTSRLVGLVGDLISLEMRGENIEFGSLKVMEKSSRSVILRNKSPLDVVVELKMECAEDWCPFSLNYTKFAMKPFEARPLEVTLACSTVKECAATLHVEYEDPVLHVVNGVMKNDKTRRKYRVIDLHGTIGKPEILVTQENVDFGDVTLGDHVVRLIELKNDQPIKTNVVIMCNIPSVELSHQLLVIPPETTENIMLKYEPQRIEQVSGFLDIVVRDQTTSIPIVGSCGGLSILKHVYDFDSGKELDVGDEMIDFGYMPSARPPKKLLVLENSGDLDLTIMAVTTREKKYFKWSLCEKDGFYDFQPWLRETVTERAVKGDKRIRSGRILTKSGNISDTTEEVCINFPAKTSLPFIISFNEWSQVSSSPLLVLRANSVGQL